MTIANPLGVGKFEVTIAEWDACVSDRACTHKPSDENWGCGKRPVINVSWYAVTQYVAWLSKKTGGAYRQSSRQPRTKCSGPTSTGWPPYTRTPRATQCWRKCGSKSHPDGSAHTRRAYARVGSRFIVALHAAGSGARRPLRMLQAELEAMRTTDDGAPAKPATGNA